MEAAKSRIVSLRGDIRNLFLKNQIVWYSPEVDPLGVAVRGSRPMIDDDRPSRQLMRCRASWEQQDARRRRHQPRIRGAEAASPLSGNQRRKFTVSQTFENSRNTEIFTALGDSLARQEGRAPRSRSLTSPLRRRSRGGAIEAEIFPAAKL